MVPQFDTVNRIKYLLALAGLRSPAPLLSRLRHVRAKGLIPIYDPSELIW